MIAEDCLWLWWRTARRSPGSAVQAPPVPFNDDSWHTARRLAILKDVRDSSTFPLDYKSRFLLMFPPAPDGVAM
eukprot:11093477-Karenia_brevis.AAC.1